MRRKRGEYYESYAVIYALTDLQDNIFYIGCTVQPLHIRLGTHISEARINRRHTNRAKNEKIRSLDFQVHIKELDRILGRGTKGYQINYAGRELELSWIVKCHHAGCNLTNNRELKEALAWHHNRKVTANKIRSFHPVK